MESQLTRSSFQMSEMLQVKYFSGVRHFVIHVVANGVVMPHLLDRNMETHLPVIPVEVKDVRFLWISGERKYNYNFYRLESHDRHLLSDPTINIARKGKIPRGAKKPGGEQISSCDDFSMEVLQRFLSVFPARAT